MACSESTLNIWVNDLCRTLLFLKHSVSLKYSRQTGFVIILLLAPKSMWVLKIFVSLSMIGVLEECPLGIIYSPALSEKQCLRLFSGNNVRQQHYDQSTRAPPNRCHPWFPGVSYLPYDDLGWWNKCIWLAELECHQLIWFLGNFYTHISSSYCCCYF